MGWASDCMDIEDMTATLSALDSLQDDIRAMHDTLKAILIVLERLAPPAGDPEKPCCPSPNPNAPS